MNKRALPFRWRAGVVFAAAILALALAAELGTGTQASAAAKSSDQPLLLFQHSIVAPRRHADGALSLGISNEVETSNWSGYAVANYATGIVYTRAKATWTVPRVAYVTPPPTCQSTRAGNAVSESCRAARVPVEYSATWVGIGGYCKDLNCTTVDHTLIQLGTSQNIPAGGQAPQYYAWVEMLPALPMVISSKTSNCGLSACASVVKAGDVITASLVCTSNCVPGQTQTWVLSMTDKNQHWTWSSTFQYASSLLSAVWIEEAPTAGGVLPLADYGTVTFVPAVNGNSAPNFAAGSLGGASPDAIQMVTPFGETSNPSIPASKPTLDTFRTCWGNNPKQIATCAVP